MLEFAPKAEPGWDAGLEAACEKYDITGVRREMFLAQCAHESAGFTRFVENLNYSADALMRTWPSRFTKYEQAVEYARQPEKIANYVYANRMGNGNEASWDGWKYRGRGVIQITGRNNYQKAFVETGINLIDHPDAAALPSVGSMIAGWFWATNGLNELADEGDFKGITKRINGGYTGQDSRDLWLAKVRGKV